MSVASPSKIKNLRRQLLSWYDKKARDLPWRKTQDPWKIWVSEIMLQQTTVDAVIPYWKRFLKRFPNSGSLARAREQTVIKNWEGLGYYTRARNLRKAAAIVSQEGFPQSADQWKSLPGIGPYTANALASIVNKQVVSVVDGNVFRVLSRFYADPLPIDSSGAREHFQALADSLVSHSRPGDFNQALMELGATVCRPKNPRCDQCPWQGDCLGQKQWPSFPKKKRKVKMSSLKVAVALIRHRDGRFLMDRRADHVVMGGLWEFPGGKIEPNETAQQALLREIYEEIGLKIRVLDSLPLVRHAYTRFRVTLYPFLCEKISGRLRVRDSALSEVTWVKKQDWARLPMPAGTRKIIQLLPKDVK